MKCCMHWAQSQNKHSKEFFQFPNQNIEHWTIQLIIYRYYSELDVRRTFSLIFLFLFTLLTVIWFLIFGWKLFYVGSSYFGEWFIVFSKIRFDCISSGCSLVRIQMYCIECWRHNHIKGSFNKSRYIHRMISSEYFCYSFCRI